MKTFDSSRLTALQANNRALDFIAVRRACPKGIYVAPSRDDGSKWEGVIFVRQGLYQPGIFRFRVTFPDQYPSRPPVISFATEIFHPLVTPLTTYTYSTQDTGADTVSATDDDRLPPGGFSLSHGFPQWFSRGKNQPNEGMERTHAPHIVEVLYYIRTALTSETLLDSLPLEAAANQGAWHAYQNYSASVRDSKDRAPRPQHGATSPRSIPGAQQPGGARKPGEWNWEGVWQDRVRKCIQSSIADQTIYQASDSSGDELINFLDVDPALLPKLSSSP